MERGLRFEAAEEPNELLMAVARIAFGGIVSLRDVQRGKEARRAVTLVFVDKGASATADQVQTRLRPI